MAMKLYSDNSVQDIADAVRRNNGKSSTYKISQMASAIDSIANNALNYVTTNILNGDSNQQETIYDGANLPVKNLSLEGNYSTVILPSEYTQVDYIQNSGTAYLDLNFNPDQDTGVEIKFDIQDVSNGGAYLYGARQSTTSRAYCGANGYAADSESSIMRLAWCYGSQGIKSIRNVNRGIHTIKQDKNNIYLDGNLEMSYEYETFSPDRSFYLFVTNAPSVSSSYYIKTRLYSCKLYDDETLIRNLIPCYRNADNKIGMYDLINDVFYTNQGGGSLTYGSVVPTADAPLTITNITNVNLSISDGTNVRTLALDLNNNEVCRVSSTVKDLLTMTNNHLYLIKNIGKIASYNGETISGAYISSTGTLSTGATVYYELENPQTIDIGEIGNIFTYDGTNYITLTTNIGTTYTLEYRQDIEELSVRDWSEIGYTGEPAFIQTGIDYAKQIQQNWTTSTNLSNKEKLVFMPLVDTSNKTNFSYMFDSCYALASIPQLDTSNGTNFGNMFENCHSLQTVALIDTSNGTSFSSMFYNCYALASIPQLDTSNGNYFNAMFYSCSNLIEVPKLNASNVKGFSNIFAYCSALTNLGGLENAGMGFETTKEANYSSYEIKLSTSTNLTEQSLINVLTNLYDIATKGCNVQKCTLGSANIAKLTSQAGQAALAQAQNYGWTIS